MRTSLHLSHCFDVAASALGKVGWVGIWNLLLNTWLAGSPGEPIQGQILPERSKEARFSPEVQSLGWIISVNSQEAWQAPWFVAFPQ